MKAARGEWVRVIPAIVGLILIFSGQASAEDCNNNGIEDAIDIATGTSEDCQPNGIPDECDLSAGSPDENGNGIPDECDLAPIAVNEPWKNRYLSIILPAEQEWSIKITIVEMPDDPDRVGDVWWAGPETAIPNDPHPALIGAPLECTATPHSQVWTNGPLHLFGEAIVPWGPSSLIPTYEVRACLPDGTNCTAPIFIGTGWWGDVTAPFFNCCPNQPTFADIFTVVEKFKSTSASPDMVYTDISGFPVYGAPNMPDGTTNFTDIAMDVDAFEGIQYPFTVPACAP